MCDRWESLTWGGIEVGNMTCGSVQWWRSKSRREEPEGDSGGLILNPALGCNGELNINHGGLVWAPALCACNCLSQTNMWVDIDMWSGIDRDISWLSCLDPHILCLPEEDGQNSEKRQWVEWCAHCPQWVWQLDDDFKPYKSDCGVLMLFEGDKWEKCRWILHERYSCLKGVQGKETSMTNTRNCPNQWHWQIRATKVTYQQHTSSITFSWIIENDIHMMVLE